MAVDNATPLYQHLPPGSVLTSASPPQPPPMQKTRRHSAAKQPPCVSFQHARQKHLSDSEPPPPPPRGSPRPSSPQPTGVCLGADAAGRRQTCPVAPRMSKFRVRFSSSLHVSPAHQIGIRDLASTSAERDILEQVTHNLIMSSASSDSESCS